MNCDKFTHYELLLQSLAQDIESFKRLSQKKFETVSAVLPDKEYTTILSYGFNLVAYGFAMNGYKVAISNCCPDCFKNLESYQMSITDNVNDIYNRQEKYDLVLAVDQATTYADTNEDQQELVKMFAGVTAKTFVTTVRDYRNQKHNDKHFDEPFYVKQGDSERIVLNHRKWDRGDRQSWTNYVYMIDQDHNLTVSEPKKRRTMYFKQLAKFLYDNSAKDYTVHKEPLYKSAFSKTFQYLITAEF